MLIINAGSGNVANYVTIRTDYAVYDFQAVNNLKKGAIQTFSFFDMKYADMMRHISISDEVTVTLKSSAGAKGKTFRMNAAQKEIFTVFYETYNMMLENTNLASLAFVYQICLSTMDHHLTVTKLKDEPRSGPETPEMVSVEAETAADEPAVNGISTEAGADVPGVQNLMPVVYTSGGKQVKVKLHSGVKLNYGIRTVVDLETTAGCKLQNSNTDSKQFATVDNAMTIELPFNMLYMHGTVAGGDNDSHINYSFTKDTRKLFRTQYYIRCAESRQKQMYADLEAKLRSIYGEPVCTRETLTLWEYSKAEVAANQYRPISNLAAYRDLSLLPDYSQWVLNGSDGSVILIEHVFQRSSLREYNLINYAYFDAQTMESLRNAEDQAYSDL